MSQTETSPLDDDIDRLPGLSKGQIKEYLVDKLPLLKDRMKCCSDNPGDAVRASCILFFHCLPIFDNIHEAEKEFLSPVLPLFNQLSSEIFTKIENLLQTEEVDDGLLQIPGILAECAKSCIQFYIGLDGLQPLNLKSFIDSMFPMVVKLNEHYINSKKLSNAGTNEVMNNLSKEVSAILSALVNLFQDKVTFDGRDQNHDICILFEKTIDFFFDVSRTAQQAELALPLLAKSWRVYYSFIAIVRRNSLPVMFDVISPLNYLSKQILHYAEISLDLTIPDNGAERLVKFSVFLMQILITIIGGLESRLVSCVQDVFNLTLSLQRWSETVIQIKGANATNRQKMVNQEIVSRVKLIVENLLDKPDFSKWLLGLQCEDESILELMLVATVLEEMSTKCSNEPDPTRQKSHRIHWIDSAVDINILSFLFCLVDKCPISLSSVSSGIYDACLSSGCLLLLSLNAEEFTVAERTLLQTLCFSWTTAWPWVLASDLWVCMAKGSNSAELCKQHILLLRQLAEQMPHGLQRRMISSLYLRITEILACYPGEIVTSECLMDFKLDQIWAQIEEFIERPTETSLQECLDALSLMRRKNARVELLGPLLRLLPFCHNSDDLSESMGLKVLAACVHYAQLLETRDLDTLLTHIPFFCSPALRVASLQVLVQLSSRRLESPSVVRLVSEAFNDLLQHHNVVVCKAALQTFVTFAHCSPHEDVVPMAVSNSNALQNTVSSFIQKQVCDVSCVDEEMRHLVKIKWTPRDEMRVEKIPGLRVNQNDFHVTDSPPHPRSPSPEIRLEQMSEGSADFSTGSSEENSAVDTQVAELMSVVNSLMKEVKHEKLCAKNKKQIRKAIAKLQGLFEDNL